MYYKESRDLWAEKISVNGKTKELTAKTKTALKEKLMHFNANQDHVLTFSEAADAWETDCSRQIEYQSYLSYKPHVQRAKDYFGNAQMVDITPDQIQAYVDSLAAKNFAKDTVRRGLVVCNRIFKHAITTPGSKVRYNPCQYAEIPRGLKNGRREAPTEDQLSKITPDGEIGLLAWFMIHTGMRNSEILALQWQDIDMESMVIHVRKAVEFMGNNPHVKDHNKTTAGTRDIPLIRRLADVLPEKRKADDFVFGGDKPLTKMELYRGWLNYCIAHGLAEEIIEEHYSEGNKHTYKKVKYKPKVTLYQFRHEYASVLEEADVSEFDAKTAMGHSSIQVTKDIYTHIKTKKHQSEVAEKLNKYYENKAAK